VNPGKRRHIHLVGFSGVGKSTCGPLIARALGMKFVDLDDVIEGRCSRNLGRIYAERGETAVRTLEAEALSYVCRRSIPSVVAMGSGVPLTRENRAAMRETGVTVYLSAPPQVLLARIMSSTQSGEGSNHAAGPLCMAAEPFALIESLVLFRAAYYMAVADLEVAVGMHTPAQAAQVVVRELANRGVILTASD